MKKLVLLVTFIAMLDVSAQDYKKLILEGTHKVEYISQVAELYFDSVGRGRGTGYKPFRRWLYFAERTMDETGKLKSPEFYYDELQKYNALNNSKSLAARTNVGAWEEIGPTYWNATSGYNPGVGRVTSMAIDDNDLNHIIVGSQTGGVWRTTNGGSSWSVLTDNLANIDVYALAIDPTNNSTYFWGSRSGSIFKSTDSGATWVLHGSLPSGNVNKILIDPTNTSKMYASSEGGGIYKSTNGGSSWSIIHSSATNGYDIAFKPGDYNTIYATGNSFFKSTDGGISFSVPDGLGAWTQEFVSGTTNWSTSNSNQNNTVSPKTGNLMALFYIGNFSFPRTQLISPSLDLSSAENPQLKFSYTNVNWDGDIDELKVLYKTSLGGTWTQIAEYTTESASWSDITLNLPNISSDYYIAFEGTSNFGRGLTLDDISVETSNQGILFSDGFENAPNDFSTGAKMIGVSINDPSVVYILEASGSIFGGLHKSTDSGVIFNKLNHGSNNYFGYVSDASDTRGQAPRDMDIAINPNDVNDVHIAGINTWRSTDGGANFSITSQWTLSGSSNENIGYCHADVGIMEFVGSGGNAKLFVGTDGGIFKADNPAIVNNNYYTDLTPGLGIRQFYKIGVSQTNPVIVTGGSQDNGSSLLGSDGSWTDWWGADGMEGFVDKNNSNIIYGTTQFGNFVKTYNSGLNISGVSQPDDKGGQSTWNWVVPYEQDPIIQNTIYCAFDEVYKSTDGGGSWTSISQNFGENIDHLKIAPTNNAFIYMAIDGQFWYTTNGGTLWTQSSLNLGVSRVNAIAVHPTNPSKVAIATTNSSKVYISTDNGVNWTSIRWNLPNFSSQALAWQDNEKDGLYVGMNYGVYYTDNTLGNTWETFNNGLPNVRINELEINSADNKIYAATYGRGLWRSNLHNETLSTNNFKKENFAMYPNPAQNTVYLKWNQPDNVSVRIYNTLGKLIYYGSKINLQNTFEVNLSAFQSGVYFVKLNTPKGELIKKLILK